MRATAEERDEIMSQAACSVDATARVLGIGRTQAYKAVKNGEIRSIRIGGRVLVPTAALRQMLDLS
jgi:excisionase family DNA binding protein